MAFDGLIKIVVIVLAILIAWTLFKKLFKILFYAVIALVIVIAVTGFAIMNDVSDIKQNFKTETKKVLLVQNDDVLAGFTLNGNLELYTDEEIKKFDANLKADELGELLGDDYKMLIFNTKVLKEIESEEFSIGESMISKNDAFQILTSDNPKELMDEIGSDILKMEIFDDGLDNSQVKAVVFASILSEHVLSAKNTFFVFSEFKRDAIRIYPETALFKTVKIIPFGFLKKTAQSVFDITKDKASELIKK